MSHCEWHTESKGLHQHHILLLNGCLSNVQQSRAAAGFLFLSAQLDPVFDRCSDCSHLSLPCVCGIMSNGTFMLFSSPDYFGLPSSSHLTPFYPNDIFFQVLCRQLWQSRMQFPGDRKWAGGRQGRAGGSSKSHKSWASRTKYWSWGRCHLKGSFSSLTSCPAGSKSIITKI